MEVFCEKRFQSNWRHSYIGQSSWPVLHCRNETWPTTEHLADKIIFCTMRMLRYCLELSKWENQETCKHNANTSDGEKEKPRIVWSCMQKEWWRGCEQGASYECRRKVKERTAEVSLKGHHQWCDLKEADTGTMSDGEASLRKCMKMDIMIFHDDLNWNTQRISHMVNLRVWRIIDTGYCVICSPCFLLWILWYADIVYMIRMVWAGNNLIYSVVCRGYWYEFLSIDTE